MNDPGWLLDNWGYIAIFAVVIPGNMGLPSPEETILILARKFLRKSLKEL